MQPAPLGILSPDHIMASQRRSGKYPWLNYVIWAEPKLPNQRTQGSQPHIGIWEVYGQAKLVIFIVNQVLSSPQTFSLQIIKFLWPKRSLSSPQLPWRKVWWSPGRTQWNLRRTLRAWFQHIGGREFRSKSFIPWELDLDKDLWDCWVTFLDLISPSKIVAVMSS